jgi:hypothetical protein
MRSANLPKAKNRTSAGAVYVSALGLNRGVTAPNKTFFILEKSGAVQEYNEIFLEVICF